MALQTKTYSAGSFDRYTGTSAGYVLELVLTELAVDAAAGTSQIHYRLQLCSGPSNRFDWEIASRLQLNGAQVASDTQEFYLDYNAVQVLLAGEATVPNTPGSSPVLDFSAEITPWADGNQYTPPAMTLAGAMALTPIIAPPALAAMASATRLDPTDGTAKLTVSGTANPAATAVSVRYRLSDGEWKTMAVTGDTNQFYGEVRLSGLDYRKSHTFQVEITDGTETLTKTVTLGRGLPVFDWSGEDFNFNVPVHFTAADGSRFTVNPDGFTTAQGAKGDKGDPGADGRSPYIGENGHWWVWDAAAGAWTDTQVAADTDAAIREHLVALANMSAVTAAPDITAYEKGSITTGGVDSTYRQDSRARTLGIHRADYDLTLYSADGVAGICAFFFSEDGTYLSVTDWCAVLEIPAGSHYRLILSLNPKADKTVNHTLQQILENFYFVSEYKIVNAVDDLAERLVEGMVLSVNPYGQRIKPANWDSTLFNMDIAEPNKIYSVLKTSAMAIANWPEGVGAATFVTLTPEVSGDTFKVQLLFEIGTQKILLRTNVSSKWSPWTALGAAGGAAKTLYVSTTGDDSAAGTEDSPLATFNQAIARGAKTIIAQPGTYAQTISAAGVNDLTIRAGKKKYDGAFQDGLNPKIVLDNSVTLNIEDADSEAAGVWYAPYAAAETSRMHQVFVSGELPLEDDSGSESEGYNANVWMLREDGYLPGDSKLVPVATLAACRDTQNTFFYDGQYIFLHPWDGVIDGFRFVVPADGDVIANFDSCDNLVLEDIQTEYGYVYGINIQNCRNATLTGCEAHHSTNGEGFRLDYTNAALSHCKARYNRNDGFNMHQNGYTKLVDCQAKYNGDDGVSHHQGCSGTIIGGEYSYNGSGGITPAFGAEVNVYNAIMRGNLYGLQVLGASGYASRTVIAMGNIMTENYMGGLYVHKNTVIGSNAIYGNDGDQILIGTDGAYIDLTANA